MVATYSAADEEPMNRPAPKRLDRTLRREARDAVQAHRDALTLRSLGYDPTDPSHRRALAEALIMPVQPALQAAAELVRPHVVAFAREIQALKAAYGPSVERAARGLRRDLLDLGISDVAERPGPAVLKLRALLADAQASAKHVIQGLQWLAESPSAFNALHCHMAKAAAFAKDRDAVITFTTERLHLPAAMWPHVTEALAFSAWEGALDPLAYLAATARRLATAERRRERFFGLPSSSGRFVEVGDATAGPWNSDAPHDNFERVALAHDIPRAFRAAGLPRNSVDLALVTLDGHDRDGAAKVLAWSHQGVAAVWRKIQRNSRRLRGLL